MKEEFIMTLKEYLELRDQFIMENLEFPLKNGEYKIQGKTYIGIVKSFKAKMIEMCEVEIDFERLWE